MATQELLGADIQMVLDVCAPLPSDRAVLRGRGRPHGAVGRSGPAAHRRRDDQALFGIVQGGTEADLRTRVGGADRRARLRRLRDRWPVGGGDAGTRCSRRSRPRSPCCPPDQPRYLMGVGDPVSIVEVDRARRRHVRLRAADPPRPARNAADRRRPAQHQAGGVRPQHRPGRCRTAPVRRAAATSGATSATCAAWGSRRGRRCAPSTTSPGSSGWSDGRALAITERHPGRRADGRVGSVWDGTRRVP